MIIYLAIGSAMKPCKGRLWLCGNRWYCLRETGVMSHLEVLPAWLLWWWWLRCWCLDIVCRLLFIPVTINNDAVT